MARPHYGAYAGLIAAASMAFTPAQAQAAEIDPVGTAGYATSIHADYRNLARGGLDSTIFSERADTTEYRRWRRGWRRGWRRRGIRGGDVLAGVLVLGGIAAIASAASNNRRRDREVVVVERDRYDRRYDDRRYDDRRYDDRRLDDRRGNPRSSGGSGIDTAVSMCLSEIERDVRVDSVDGATRVANGWIVSGSLFNGSGFSCEIGNDGRISGIEYGGFSSSRFAPSETGSAIDNRASAEFSAQLPADAPADVSADVPAQGQLSDRTYADARAAISGQRFAGVPSDAQPLVPLTSDRTPAYPGGPLPGEEEPSQ